VFRILQLWFCEYFVTRWQPRGTKDYRSGVIHHIILHLFLFCKRAFRSRLRARVHRCGGTFYDLSVQTIFSPSTVKTADEQIVWTNKSFDVRLMCKRDEQIFRRTNRLIFVGLKRRFLQDDLSVETNKSTTVRDKFTSDGQMPDDLSVQTICSSSSVKTANVWALKSRCKRTQIAASDICRLQTADSWRVIRVQIKRANFLRYEYWNSSFISHYFLILFFSKPLLPNCISLSQS